MFAAHEQFTCAQEDDEAGTHAGSTHGILQKRKCGLDFRAHGNAQKRYLNMEEQEDGTFGVGYYKLLHHGNDVDPEHQGVMVMDGSLIFPCVFQAGRPLKGSGKNAGIANAEGFVLRQPGSDFMHFLQGPRKPGDDDASMEEWIWLFIAAGAKQVDRLKDLQVATVEA